MFATRADLLARCNARRLSQLAVPTDREMVVDEQMLRIAIEGGDLTGYSDADQASLTLALEVIDKALQDASEFIVSYGIPADAQSSLLARLAATVAIYYLQGIERITEEVQKAYDDVVDMLTKNAKGIINILPPTVTVTDNSGAEIWSNPSRYD